MNTGARRTIVDYQQAKIDVMTRRYNQAALDLVAARGRGDADAVAEAESRIATILMIRRALIEQHGTATVEQ